MKQYNLLAIEHSNPKIKSIISSNKILNKCKAQKTWHSVKIKLMKELKNIMMKLVRNSRRTKNRINGAMSKRCGFKIY